MFKNQKEIYQALLDGKTIFNISNKYIQIKLNGNGNLNSAWSFVDPSDWNIYTPPKYKKKITFYECIYQSSTNDALTLMWIDDAHFMRFTGYTKTGIQREVEIDEI